MAVHRCWAVLVACSAIAICTGPGHSSGLASFFDHFLKDFCVTRPYMSGVWGVSMLCSSLALPFAGHMLDTIGVRPVAFAASVTFALGLVCMSLIQGPVQLGVVLCVLRFAGPECMYLCANATINRWFVERRGQAMSIKGFFENLTAALPAVCTAMIAHSGWRRAYQQLAAVIGVLSVASCFALQTQPESVGLLPDGRSQAPEGAGGCGNKQKPSGGSIGGGGSGADITGSWADAEAGCGPQDYAQDPNYSLRDALRTRVFWVVLLTNCSFAGVSDLPRNPAVCYEQLDEPNHWSYD